MNHAFGRHCLMTGSINPRQNRLLAALPESEFLRLAPELEGVSLHQGQALYESGSTITYVYFPTSALVSLVYEFADGASAETSIVGNEGFVGIAVFMGGDSRLGRAVVLKAGYAFRLPAHVLRDESRHTGPLLRRLLRYTQALITQISQTAACNRHHSLDQRLCRWLLLSLDRMQDNDVGMTQELIANMLGVRREGVTAAAQRLQRLGLVRCTRGHIVVLDRRGLEQLTCECYEVVRNEYQRLLPDPSNRAALDDATAEARTEGPSTTGLFATEPTTVARRPTVATAGLE